MATLTSPLTCPPKRLRRALRAVGAFFLVPWFFVDFKNAEAQEYEAYRQRGNHLSRLTLVGLFTSPALLAVLEFGFASTG